MHYFVNAVNKYASGTPIYFTYVAYKMLRNIYGIDIEYNKCLLVTSIANPLPIVDYLVSKNMDVVQYKRQDHAQYDISDIKKIVSTCKINSIKT
jgi:tetraacyldisaccharide-1-P 4'-kinase